MPPHLESRTLNRSAVFRATAASASGKPQSDSSSMTGTPSRRRRSARAIDLGMRHGLLQGRRAEPPQGLDALDQLGCGPRLVGIEPDVHPPAEDPPQGAEPPRIILSLGAHLHLHLVEAVDPDLHGRPPFAESGLGRDGPAVPYGPGCRVTVEAPRPRPARRPAPPTRRTGGRMRRARPAPGRTARHCPPCPAGPTRSPGAAATRAARPPGGNRPAGRSRAPSRAPTSTPNVDSTVSPVTYGRGTPSP